MSSSPIIRENQIKTALSTHLFLVRSQSPRKLIPNAGEDAPEGALRRDVGVQTNPGSTNIIRKCPQKLKRISHVTQIDHPWVFTKGHKVNTSQRSWHIRIDCGTSHKSYGTSLAVHHQ